MIQTAFHTSLTRNRRILIGLFMGVGVMTSAALLLSRYPRVGWMDLASLSEDPIAMNLFLRLRVPRVISALLSGAILGAGGMVTQTVFANPIASPDIIGISQGASVGAAIAIIFFGNTVMTRQLFAFIGGLIGICLSLGIANSLRYGGWILRLLLSGAAVSAFLSGALTILKLVADGNNQLHQLEFWLMGGYGYTTIGTIPTPALLTLTALIGLWSFRWRLNLFSLPDESSGSLGVALTPERIAVLMLTVVGVSAMTSISGIIGWIGLVAPHIARILFGADSRMAFPGAVLSGAVITLFADTLIRMISPREMPIGFAISFLCVTILFILISLKKIQF